MLIAGILSTQPVGQEERPKALRHSHSRENLLSASSCLPSVSLHVSARFLMDGFVLNLIQETFIKMCMEYLILFTIGQNCLTQLH
jgi:hypothetical protein